MDMISRGSALRILPETLRLPKEVSQLLRREREIATIVYALRAATAEQVCQHISDPLANASVRSMLNRLVAKGIVKRSLSGRAYIYMPALTSADSGVRALRQFAIDYFEGSMTAAAETMRDALRSHSVTRNAPIRSRKHVRR